MRPFILVRHTDVTGVSGVGVVAEGVEFLDGTVALRWLTEWPTSVVFHERGMESVEHVHGHNGATEIIVYDKDVLFESKEIDIDANEHIAYRDAGSGRYVTEQYAWKHPDTTVGETSG